MKESKRGCSINKQTKLLSFVGGIIFFSAVTGIIIMKNQKIKTELERQASSILTTSKGVIQQVQLVVERVGKITGDFKSDKENNKLDSDISLFLTDGYDKLWASAESQSSEYVKNHLS